MNPKQGSLEEDEQSHSRTWSFKMSYTQQKSEIQTAEPFDEIYNYIISQHYIEKISIEGTEEVVEKGKNYIVYHVFVKIGTGNYSVNKRYREFFKLHNDITSKYKKIQLPKFPEKKWLSFLSSERKIIQMRKEQLTLYLRAILDQLPQIQCTEFLDFIEIKEQFKKRGIMNVKHNNMSFDVVQNLDLHLSSKKYFPQNEEERMAFAYLEKLNHSEDSRAKLFEKLETLMKNIIQKVSYNMIQILFVGDQESKILGFTQMITPTSQGHISCVPGFKLIRRILEHDYNSNAEVALKAFQDLNVKQFGSIKMSSHISSNNFKCKNDALSVLHKYIQRNSMSDQFVQFLLEDKTAYDEYIRYKFKKSVSISKFRIKNNDDNSNEELKDSLKSCIGIGENRNQLKISVSCDATSSPTKNPIILNRISQSNESNPVYLDSRMEPDDLYFLSQNQQVPWKKVINNPNSSLYHVMGRVLQMKFLLEDISIDRALYLMTEGQNHWNLRIQKYQVLKRENENQSIILRRATFQKVRETKQVVFIEENKIERYDDRAIIRTQGIEKCNNFMEYLEPADLMAQECCFTLIDQKEDNKVFIHQISQLCEANSQAAALSFLLNENLEFNQICKNLSTFIQSEQQ